jgi:hypothetical protein
MNADLCGADRGQDAHFGTAQHVACALTHPVKLVTLLLARARVRVSESERE